MKRINYWAHKLDELKEKLNVSSDVELSFELRVGTGMLSHIRKGRRPAPIAIGVDILHRLGYVIDRKLLISLLNKDARAVIAKIDHDSGYLGQPVAEIDANAGRELPPDDDDEMTEEQSGSV
jgi:hypothetical protein